MTASAISQDALTADEFVKSPEPFTVLLSIDEAPIDAERFGLTTWLFAEDLLRFTIDQKTVVDFEEKKEVIKSAFVLDIGAAEPAYWKLFYQIEVHLGGKEVDRFNADFTVGSRPISIEFEEPEERRLIHFQLRTISRLCRPLPKFTEGDVTLHFKNDPPLRTWRSLLSLVSPYMAEKLSDSDCGALNLGDFPRENFEQLLFQLYATNWPIWLSFGGLAKAVVGFDVPFLLYKLNKQLVDSEAISIEKKWELAISLELDLALEILLQKDVISGDWNRRIADGFDPKSFFSSSPLLVQRAVLQGLGSFPLSQLKDPWTPPDYLTVSSPSTVPLLFRGTTFHVNEAVLLVRGWLKDKKSLAFSQEMHYFCASDGLIPGDVLTSLLNSMYPGGPRLETRYLKAALVLCLDNGLQVDELEERLLLQPIRSAKEYLEELKFAEKYQLGNMLRALLFRIETSCSEMAKEVKHLVSEKTRQTIEKREKTPRKWAVVGVRKATTVRQRKVEKEDNQEETLAGLHSDYILGEQVQLSVL